MQNEAEESQVYLRDCLSRALGCLLAHVVSNRWPAVQLGLIVPTDQGFFCDFATEGALSETEFPRLEAELRKLLETGAHKSVKLECMSLEEASGEARKSKQSYLMDFLAGLAGQTKGVCCLKYAGLMIPCLDTSGNPVAESASGHLAFTDLPEGILRFKLKSVGGAYWRGQADQPQLQRLHVVVFLSEEEMTGYLSDMSSRQASDHRQIGAAHDIFTFSNLVGAGLPLWLENGAVMRRQIENLIVEEETKRGYVHVYTPDITQLQLYETSGHYPYYMDSMYPPIKLDDQEFMLRPMSCPHHYQLYLHRPRSFRELPMRLAELAKLYRREKSGELSGLLRVRTFTLSDAHIFCRPDQAESEITGALDLIDDMTGIFGLKKGRDYFYRLSLGDREDDKKFYKDDQAWQIAEDVLRSVLRRRGDQFVEAAKEAAFYGPKIDIQMHSQGGKEETAFTVQYDFVMPKRFQLTYTDSDNQKREVIVIHRSSIGSIERFIGLLLEFYDGRLPVWLAGCQLRILTPADADEAVTDYGRQLERQALERKIRVKIDASPRSLGKKVRQAHLDLVPYVIVVGKKEMAAKQFVAQIRPDLRDKHLSEDKAYDFDTILTAIDNHVASKS